MELTTQIVVPIEGSDGPDACEPEKSYASMTLMDFDAYANPETLKVQVPIPCPLTSTEAIGTEIKRSPRKCGVQTRQSQELSEFLVLNQDEQCASVKAKPSRGRRQVATKRASSVSSDSSEVRSTKDTVQKDKKRKLHESSDPEAKNARAAKLNRERKKQAMESLQLSNTSLQNDLRTKSEALEDALNENRSLQTKVKMLENKNRAVVGLNRISQSSKELLDSVMPPLLEKFGISNVTCAKWFNEVTTVTPAVEAVADAPTSSYITMYISMENKSVLLDYSPDEPILSDEIPE